MGMLSAFAGPPQRQLSLLYRVRKSALLGALPDGLEPVEREGWVLLEMACATPLDLPLSGVALIAWRTPVLLGNGSSGQWVLERWTSARLGAGWPDRWSSPATEGTDGSPARRHALWVEDEAGELQVDVRSGRRRAALRATPTAGPERSLFLSTRQAEGYLAGCGGVINAHPLSWLIDRSALSKGQAGLTPLAVHSLDVSSPLGLSGDDLELDCAFRVDIRRRLSRAVRNAREFAERRSLPNPAFSLNSSPNS